MKNLIPTEFDGRHALVIGVGHPKKGTTGECLGAQKVNGIFQMIFRDLKTREEFVVMSGGDINWIKYEKPKRVFKTNKK